MKKDSNGISSEIAMQALGSLEKIGCRCVIDEQLRKTCKSRIKSVLVQ